MYFFNDPLFHLLWNDPLRLLCVTLFCLEAQNFTMYTNNWQFVIFFGQDVKTTKQRHR